MRSRTFVVLALVAVFLSAGLTAQVQIRPVGILARLLGTSPSGHALGTASNENYGLFVAPTISAPGNDLVLGLAIAGSLTGYAGQDISGSYFGSTLIEAASGTHALLSQVRVVAPTITGAAATVTNAATMYVSGAPAATVAGANYSIWSAGGPNRFDGQTAFGVAPDAHYLYRIAGSVTPPDAGDSGVGLNFHPTINAFAGTVAYGMFFGPTIVEAASGNHGSIQGVRFSAPTITGGAATVTDAITVHITGPPSATVTGKNLALLVGDASAGAIRFSGLTTYADNTAATGAGLIAGQLYRTSTGVVMVTY